MQLTPTERTSASRFRIESPLIYLEIKPASDRWCRLTVAHG